MPARVINFTTTAARIKRGQHQSPQTSKTRADRFGAVARQVASVEQTRQDPAHVLADMLANVRQLRTVDVRNALAHIYQPTNNVHMPAVSSIAEELSDIKRRLARIEAAVCRNGDRTSADRDKLIVAGLSVDPRVNAVFVQDADDADIEAYIVVAEHDDGIYDFAAEAEHSMNKALRSLGVSLSVHVWADQGRGPLASPPPSARALFVRG